MAVKRSEIQQHISRAVRTPVERIVAQPAGQPPTSVDPSPFSRRPAEPAPMQAPTQEQIAVAAYYRAVARGFAPGQEMEDWLAAERELESRSRG